MQLFSFLYRHIHLTCHHHLNCQQNPGESKKTTVLCIPYASIDLSFLNSFIMGNWSECSKSCSQGFRSRSNECKVFREFSQTVADHECPAERPSSQTCIGDTCSSYSSSMARQEPPPTTYLLPFISLFASLVQLFNAT